MCFTAKKQTLGLAATLFSAIAIVHAVRLIQRWPASVAGWTVPVWISGLALVVTGYLGWELFKLAREEKK